MHVAQDTPIETPLYVQVSYYRESETALILQSHRGKARR